MPISAALQTYQPDPYRLAALRALLRDNTGIVSPGMKAEAFRAIASSTSLVDIRV